MKIICVVDSSKSASRLLDAMAAIASRSGDSLHLLNIRGSDSYDIGSPEAVPALTGAQLSEQVERLGRLGISVKEQLLWSPADEKLVKLSRQRGVRLIALAAPVGSAGWDGPDSVSERTAESASVPTLVLRNSAIFEDWAEGRRVLRVFVAVDFTVSAEAALRWVKDFKRIGPCEITAGYINWPPVERERLGITGSQPLTENLSEVQDVLERDLGAWAAEILGESAIAVRVEPNWGRADTALIEMVRKEKADVVVTGTHQNRGLDRLGNWSVSRSLLRHAPVSVVCVPTPTSVAHGQNRLPRIRRVLTATDFSALGDHAVPHAYAALVNAGVVRLVHVLPPRKGQSNTVPMQRQITITAKKLRALIPLEARSLGIATETEVLQDDDVASAICQAAERFGADIICIGTHGRSGISAAVLGSVARGVMAKSKRPLLAVPAPVA